MPWNKNNYPNSMKNLDNRVRDKAIDIANALLEEDYEEGRAIPIAISQAKKWAEKHDDDQLGDDIHVIPHPRGWAVRRENGERASFVMDTKGEARKKAMEMAIDEQVDVVIHDNDGEIQTYIEVEKADT